MSLPRPARTLVKTIIASYSQNQAPANLRHANSANYVGCSWLAEMHWLVETDSPDRHRTERAAPEGAPACGSHDDRRGRQGGNRARSQDARAFALRSGSLSVRRRFRLVRRRAAAFRRQSHRRTRPAGTLRHPEHSRTLRENRASAWSLAPVAGKSDRAPRKRPAARPLRDRHSHHGRRGLQIIRAAKEGRFDLMGAGTQRRDG